MKLAGLIVSFGLSFLWACSGGEDPSGTDVRKAVYPLYEASEAGLMGEVTFTDLGEGVVKVSVAVENATAGSFHPVHLHFGSISVKGNLAFSLNPVDGSTGLSETILEQQELDGWLVDYELLVQLDGSIKVHMDDEALRDQVLVYGNVGINSPLVSKGITTCTGH